MLRLIPCLLFMFSILAAEENFLLINGKTDEIIVEFGPHIDEQMTPCSSFKIALSLMGYDAGILQDEETPVWDYKEGYDDYLERWKTSINPKSWMNLSCIWYSKIIAIKLGPETLQNYLTAFEYGNQDISGLKNPTWVNSSLKISPREQVNFIQKMFLEKLSISSKAIQMTKAIIFKEDLPNGWKLFGKTGWGGSTNKLDGINEISWFVGFVEKDNDFLPFAYQSREPKIDLKQRIPRVKQLLSDILN